MRGLPNQITSLDAAMTLLFHVVAVHTDNQWTSWKKWQLGWPALPQHERLPAEA